MFAPSLRLSIEIPSATEISVLKSSWIVRALVSTDVILPSMSPAQAPPTATTNTSASATPSIFFIVTPPDRLVSRLARACAANRRRADRFNGKRRAIAGHLGEARKLTRLCRDWRSGKRRRGSVLQTGVANRGEPGGLALAHSWDGDCGFNARSATTPARCCRGTGFSTWYWHPARQVLARCSGPVNPVSAAAGVAPPRSGGRARTWLMSQ